MLSEWYLIWFWGILLSRQTLHAQHGVHFVADNVSTTCCVLCSRRPLHNTLCTLYHTSSPQHVRFRSDVAHWKLSTLLANHGVIVGQPCCHCWPTMVSLLANHGVIVGQQQKMGGECHAKNLPRSFCPISNTVCQLSSQMSSHLNPILAEILCCRTASI